MSETTPQFGTAEYPSAPDGEICKSCKQTLSGSYYRVNGMLACERCVDQLKTQQPKDTHSAFVRGLVFGIGGAVAGMILYAVFGIVTGLVIGYISLAVGYIVGKAMKFGSGGIGGRRYQIAAALLTYAAVSVAAIPMSISEAMKDKKAEPAAQVQPIAPADSAGSATPAPSRKNSEPSPNLASVLGMLALIGLASPFLALQDPFHGLIGLVILFVGIRIAWQLTAGPKLDILGPFRASAAASSPSAS